MHGQSDDFTRDVVVFVLGGPGAGKGTQCEKLGKKYGFTHLSAGDLLREERHRPGSEVGDLINTYIREGKIVPMHITIGLLKAAMLASGKHHFLIDGFPRDVSQGMEFEKLICNSTAMIFFDCSEDTLLSRLSKRGETSGRVDDNLDSIKKRFATFNEQTIHVKDWSRSAGKLYEVPCDGSVDVVFQLASETLERVMHDKSKKFPINHKL